MVIQAVEKRMGGVIGRLERGVAAGLAQIATDMKARVDSHITEKFALVAGEVRIKLRKLEQKVAKTVQPAEKVQVEQVSEMQNVQAECQRMLDRLNQQILNARQPVPSKRS